MRKPRAGKRTRKPGAPGTLTVRLDEESKRYLAKAAELRRISISDYVRSVTVAQALREVMAAQRQTIHMTAEEQSAFWSALNEPPRLTDAQRELGAAMQGRP